MKCLSLKQPFAELVVSGRKTIELRSWNTHYRGPFLVHASGNADEDACSRFGMDPRSLAKRVIMGKALLYDVKEYKGDGEFARDREKHLATDNYSSSRFGFILKDAVRFKEPIPMKGMLGFFEASSLKDFIWIEEKESNFSLLENTLFFWFILGILFSVFFILNPFNKLAIHTKDLITNGIIIIFKPPIKWMS